MVCKLETTVNDVYEATTEHTNNVYNSNKDSNYGVLEKVRQRN